MFIETHQYHTKSLAFIKSGSIQAFPCGRRRSKVTEYDINNDGTISENESLIIPFDPEARLNTEANNRKHSSLNGFTQTYLKDWDETNKLLTMSLAGYLFTISLTDDYVSADNFGKGIIDVLGAEAEETEKIYTNILLEEIPLFEGFKNYYTSILRNQPNSTSVQEDGTPETSLDLPKAGASVQDLENFENYYFSGLSFSVVPLTDIAEPRNSVKNTDNEKQQFVSLCILEKVKTSDDGVDPEVWEWKVHEPARLPFIEHDVLQDSIKMGKTHVRESLTVDNNATVTGNFTVVDKVEVIADNTKVKNKLVVENNIEVLNHTITTKDLTAAGTITATTDLGEANNIEATKADISALTGENATISDIVGRNTVSSANMYQNGYNVPIIELVQSDAEYQLKISRIGTKS